jgi:hypothetical protein
MPYFETFYIVPLSESYPIFFLEKNMTQILIYGKDLDLGLDLLSCTSMPAWRRWVLMEVAVTTRVGHGLLVGKGQSC